MLHRLKDPVIRTKVCEEMKESGFEYEKVEISSSFLDKNLLSRKIIDIAKSQNKSVEDAIIDILIASDGRVITSMEVLDEENIKKAIVHPFSMIATNGVGYGRKHLKTGESVHPRSFGTFMKVLKKYVMDEKILPFEEAIKKMTHYPAEKFGLKKRGKLEKGYFADILIIDKNKISAPSTKDNPYQYSCGIEYSFINGEMVIKEGKYMGEKKGRIIKH